jgi:antitoxin component of MazEF toxin-antitoxin module
MTTSKVAKAERGIKHRHVGHLEQSCVDMPGTCRRREYGGERCPLTVSVECDYSDYMTVRLIRIGNSRGIRLPNELIRLYGLREGNELQIEERREGLLLHIGNTPGGVVSWESAYRELAIEDAEQEEWSVWDATSGDAVED